MAHSLLSPSAAHRWMHCPASLVLAPPDENRSSIYADDGSASHELGAWALKTGKDCHEYPEPTITINDNTFTIDDERIGYTQSYVDDVRRRAMGGILLVEHHVDLSPILGEGQGGTCDAGIILPAQRLLIVEDLKYGVGEKVSVKYGDTFNEQLMLYAYGLLLDIELMGYGVDHVQLVIHQPRVGNIAESELIHIDVLKGFSVHARSRSAAARRVLAGTPKSGDFAPSDRTCRWCAAKATCPALRQFVLDEVKNEFDVQAPTAATPPTDAVILSQNMIAVPLVEQWCKAVREAVHERVAKGETILGSDSLPLKYVEGDAGNRKWADEEQAEALLVGQLGPKAYQPQKVITAPAAGKLLDKKATKQLWLDVFVPLIVRAPGRPTLVEGSDTRPPITIAATANEFEELGE